MRVHPLRSTLSSALAISSIFVTIAAGTSARVGQAPVTKEQDVITVGTGPYAGPTAAELAKRVTVQHESSAVPPEAKAAAVSTIGPAPGSKDLTPAQLAKLQTLLRALPPPVPEMVKLPPLEVPKDGIPEMTAQEQEKLAQIEAHGGSTGTPASENGGEVTPVGQPNGHGAAGSSSVPATGAQGSGKAVPTTPQKVSGSDR